MKSQSTQSPRTGRTEAGKQPSSRLRPKLSMLNREACLRIHQASLEILHRTGVMVHAESGLALLREAGAALDGELARIPPTLVERALATAPGPF